MFKLIVLLVASLGAIFFLYMGFYHQVQIEDFTLPPKVLLYKEYVGDYRNIDKAIQALDKDLTHLSANYQEFAMYYDAPLLLNDVTKSRAIIGVLIDVKDRQKAVDFLVNHATYRIYEYSNVKGLSTTFPYRNGLSMAWIIYKVYPALADHARTRGLYAKGHNVGAIEIYHYKTGESTVQIVFPYGEEAQELMLNKSPAPSYKVQNPEL